MRSHLAQVAPASRILQRLSTSWHAGPMVKTTAKQHRSHACGPCLIPENVTSLGMQKGSMLSKARMLCHRYIQRTGYSENGAHAYSGPRSF